jgi:hypothetical protein
VLDTGEGALILAAPASHFRTIFKPPRPVAERGVLPIQGT